MSIISRRQQVVFTGLLFLLLLVLQPRAGHDGDMNFWYGWAIYIYDRGLPNIYQLPTNNYNPLYHYILWVYDWLLDDRDKILHYIRLVKGFTLLFDFAGAFWAASLVTDRSRRFGLALLLLLNVAYLYNSVIWVQVDSIYTFFAFGAVVLATQQRGVASIMCFVLALAAKTQAIIFLPPLLLLWGPQWWQQPWRLVRALLGGAGLAVLILAPFIWWSWENYVPRIIEINRQAADLYPFLSMGAYNLWHLISAEGKGPRDVSDLLFFHGLTYRSWGLLMFCATSAVALLPLLVAAWQSLRRRPGTLAAPSLPLVLLSSGSIPLLFAFFNTQMHERYWHAALLFLAAYGFVRRDYLPYVLMSVAYGLNLESVLQHLHLLKYGVALFHPVFIAVLFALLIAVIVYKIYQLAPWRAAPPAPVVTRPAAVPVPVAG